MKQALISPIEILNFFDGTTGHRVAQVEADGFEVAPPLYWRECPDEVNASTHYWTGGEFALIPETPDVVEDANLPGPTLSSGTIPVAIL